VIDDLNPVHLDDILVAKPNAEHDAYYTKYEH
jgi:hypothetical protein